MFGVDVTILKNACAHMLYISRLTRPEKDLLFRTEQERGASLHPSIASTTIRSSKGALISDPPKKTERGLIIIIAAIFLTHTHTHTPSS